MTGTCLFCQSEYKKRETKRKFCSIRCANNFNRNGSNYVILPEHSEALAEFIGICLGDGYTGVYQTAVTLNAFADKEYIPYVVALMQKLFPGVSISSIHRKDNAIDIRINSKIVSDFLKTNGIIARAKFIPEWIKANRAYARACVRGLFDTEGSISFKLYKRPIATSVYKQLNFRNTDSHFMQFVRDTLLTIPVKPTMTLKKSLYLSNNKHIEIFRSIIGFHNPKLLRKSAVITFEQYMQYHQEECLKREFHLHHTSL